MRGQRGVKGVKGNEVYSILGCRVPTTSVGARGEGGKGEQRGVKGSKGGKGEQRGLRGAKGAKGSEGERSVFYTRL